jgi:heterodisulfide reductase subunit C
MGICLVRVLTQRVRRHTIGLVHSELLTDRPLNTMKLSYLSRSDRADDSCSRPGYCTAGCGSRRPRSRKVPSSRRVFRRKEVAEIAVAKPGERFRGRPG